MQLGNLGYDEDEIKEMDHKAATAILREADPNYESEDEDEEALGYCSTFGELPTKMKLTLLRAMIDQLLQTEEYASECYQRDEQRAEKEKELKQKEMEKRRAAAAVAPPASLERAAGPPRRPAACQPSHRAKGRG